MASNSFATAWTVAHQLLHPWDFPGKRELPFTFPGNFPDTRTEPTSSALVGEFYTTKLPWKCTIVGGDSKPTYLKERLFNQKINDTEVFINDTTYHLDLVDIHRTFHSKQHTYSL